MPRSRWQIEDDLRALHDNAEGRALNGGEQTRWTTLMGELRENDLRLASLSEHVERNPNAVEHTTPGENGNGRSGRDPWATTRGQDSRSFSDADMKSLAVTALERCDLMPDNNRKFATELVERKIVGVERRVLADYLVAASDPNYGQAFMRMLADPTGWTAELSNEERHAVRAVKDAKRAMSLTDASGGFAVPLPIDPTLVSNYDVDVHPFRQLATVRTIVTDQLRTVNSTQVTASFDAEGAEVSDDSTTFANIDVTVHMARAFIPYSIEIGMDYPAFTADIGMLLADAKVDLEAEKFVTGTGTGEPFGIVTALTGTSSEITSNTTDVFAIGDVYDVDEELPAKWRARAQWAANHKIYQAIREAGGANLNDFWENLSQGRPARLLGHPAHEASTMDGVINAAADNRVLILGDWRNFYIVDRIGLSVELVPHLFHTTTNRPSGQRGVFAFWRVGADSVNDRAFRMLNVT